MKRLNRLPEHQFLSLFFTCFSLSFIVAAFLMPDRANMLTGLIRIISSPTLSSTNFFSLGGYAATFLNMGLVGFICTAFYNFAKENQIISSLFGGYIVVFNALDCVFKYG